MATLGTTALTLADYAKRLGPDNKISKIIEILNDTNEILDDMMWVEGNLPTGHRTTIRSGLPSVTWRQLNYGVQPSKSRTVQVDDACGMLEAYSEIDKSLADLNGNAPEFRLSEDKAFIEAMSQELASAVFYGNSSVDPEKIMGLAPRFNSTSAENGGNVIKSDGSGSDNSSIWLVSWGDMTAHGIYPKGSTAGLNHKDLGEVTLEDANGGKYQGYRSHYKWDCGLTVRDWRYVVRICNIDISNLTKNAATGSDIVDLMVRAINKLPSTKRGRPVFYANNTVLSFLDRQVMNRSNIYLTYSDYAGKQVLNFRGIPVKKCDALTETEATVS